MSTLETAPRARRPDVDLLLFTGPLSVGEELAEEGLAPTPSMWWPHDRAWLVSTGLDWISTYVGASRSAIDAVINAPDLEALEVSIDDRA